MSVKITYYHYGIMLEMSVQISSWTKYIFEHLFYAKFFAKYWENTENEICLFPKEESRKVGGTKWMKRKFNGVFFCASLYLPSFLSKLLSVPVVKDGNNTDPHRLFCFIFLSVQGHKEDHCLNGCSLEKHST